MSKEETEELINIFFAPRERDEYKQALLDIKEFVEENTTSYYTNLEETEEEFELICKPQDILDIVNKALGSDKE